MTDSVLNIGSSTSGSDNESSTPGSDNGSWSLGLDYTHKFCGISHCDCRASAVLDSFKDCSNGNIKYNNLSV